MISKSDGTNITTYSYDALNRLTAIDLPNTTNDVQLGYNGNNERISKTVGSQTTQYLIDSNSSLPQIIQETTGTQTTSYLLGLDLIAQDNGTSRQYLLTDALGSTRNLTDNTGASVKEINYDIFGSVRTQSGTANTSFKFTGEQTDDESGLIFLRARYYDPEIGRFISKDPHPGHADVSQSLNRYLYVQNNPINFIDPSGLDKEAAEKIQSAINLLKKSKSASDIVPILERLNKDGKIVFAELDFYGPSVLGKYNPWNNKIKIDQSMRDADMRVLAITIAHEGQHAKNRFKYGFWGPFQLRNELSSYELQAKIWPEIQGDYKDQRMDEIVTEYQKGTLREYVKSKRDFGWMESW